MGFFSSFSGNNKQVVNVEFVLEMLDKLIPPVGFIYMSTSSANPSTIYPGTTWAAWGKGKVPVGVDTSDSNFNTVEKSGGSKTHLLTTAEMPNHNHPFGTSTSPVYTSYFDANHTHQYTGLPNGSNLDWGNDHGGYISELTTSSPSEELNHRHSIYGNTGGSGSGEAHNNLQPYITCYMWKRTA
jgi:microcystin-dependent protein